MRKTAELAREHGVRLHTHLAETRDEDEYCEKVYGCRPTEYCAGSAGSAPTCGWRTAST
jgi:cytosine/adenosine deaminase-related metal-dependent hydrolase